MGLYVIGVNYKTTPVQIREKFSIDQQEHEGILSSIRLLDGVSECALLSTCNRTELHIFSENTLLDAGHVETRLCALKGIDIYQVKKYFYVYEGMDAIKHIVKVASGMDSMVLGEDQILGQFRNAYGISMKEGTSKAVLNTLSRLAITSSKKIKTRNLKLGKASSVAGRVGELLSGIYGEALSDKHFLIIGSGEMGNIVLKELLHLGAHDIYMTMRSMGSLEGDPNSELKAKPVSYHDRHLYIEQCDIVISATSSPHYTVTRDMLGERITDKKRRRIFIDLAVPRDIDESIRQIESVCLYNIDDLKSIVCKKSKYSHQLDLRYTEEQINCLADEFIRWFQYRNTLCCREN